MDVLASDGPGGLQHQRATGGHAQLGADLGPSPRAGPFVEPVVDGGGRDPPPLRERPAGLLVDRHVPPLRVVGRPPREPGVLLALPRQVVVAQHGGPPRQVLRHRLPDARVHRQRADVVDDHEVDVVERIGELGARRRPDRVDGEALDEHVGPAGTGHRRHLQAESAQGGRPLCGRHRDAVGHAEPVGQDRRASTDQVHHVRIIAATRGAGRGTVVSTAVSGSGAGHPAQQEELRVGPQRGQLCHPVREREQRRDRADVPDLVVVEPGGARGVEVLGAEPGRLGGQLRATGARPRAGTTPRALYGLSESVVKPSLCSPEPLASIGRGLEATRARPAAQFDLGDQTQASPGRGGAW